MKNVTLSLLAAAAIGAISIGSVSAMPVNNLAGLGENHFQGVRLVCDRFGRCYNTRRLSSLLCAGLLWSAWLRLLWSAWLRLLWSAWLRLLRRTACRNWSVQLRVVTHRPLATIQLRTGRAKYRRVRTFGWLQIFFCLPAMSAFGTKRTW